MKETLHIKNFGPIKEVKLELGKVNVLIGGQGTGKSTVAKIFSIIIEMARGKGSIVKGKNISNEDFIGSKEQLEFLLKYYNISTFLTSKTYLLYKSVDFSYQFENEKGIFTSNARIPNFERYSLIYIPTERAIVPILSKMLFALNELQISLPSYLSHFGNQFSYVRESKNEYVFEDFFDIKYSYKNEIDSVTINDKTFELKEIASGFQSIIPFLIIYSWFTNADNYEVHEKFDERNLIIEEPELNLFPNAQKKLLDFIISKNTIKNNSYHFKTTIITTHSPYILTSLNNLIYAYTVGQEYKTEVNEIIAEQYWLNPEDVSAYMLVYDEKQGGCIAKNIIDVETQLIDSVQIDGVSDVLSEEFNQIMAIKLGV